MFLSYIRYICGYLHLRTSTASQLLSLSVFPISYCILLELIAASTPFLHVSLGLPRFLLCNGVHSIFALTIYDQAFCSRKPFQLFNFNVSVMFMFASARLLISSFLTISGLSKQQLLLQYSVSAALNFCLFLLVKVQTSDPYIVLFLP